MKTMGKVVRIAAFQRLDSSIDSASSKWFRAKQEVRNAMNSTSSRHLPIQKSEEERGGKGASL